MLFLTACASQPGVTGKGDQNDPWIVKVSIDPNIRCKILAAEAEPNTCGLADRSDICVQQDKFIQWESDPAGTGFKIYFDPVVGRPFKSSNGKLKTRIDEKAPPAMYKYTITGGGNCDPNNQADILDPGIRVDKRVPI